MPQAVVLPPSPPSELGELEALIREARARQRKRKVLTAATTAALAAGVFVVYSMLGAGSSVTRTQRPRSIPTVSPKECATAQLRLVGGRIGVAAGTASQAFTFVNESGRSCTLRGWPTIGLVLRDGRRITPRVQHWHYFTTTVPNRRLRAKTIALRPGGAGSFIVLAQDFSSTRGRPCRLVRTMSVTPPGAKDPLTVLDGIGIYCVSLIVPPLVAGRNPPYP